MTERKHNDQPLDDYLNGKSPISDHYRQLDGSQPGADIDARILQAARREAHARQTRRHWRVPLAIAATLVLGISILWWQQHPTTPPLNSTQSAAPSPDKSLPDQVDRSLHDNPAADQWLSRILKLQQAGKTAQAAAEFKKFRQAYPAYSIDQQRFGALQQYDQSP